MGTARGCKIELEEKELRGTGTSFETAIARGKVKELRIGVLIGAGLQGRAGPGAQGRDGVGGQERFGPHGLARPEVHAENRFENPVYACGPDGAWKLFGRAKPEMLVKPLPKKP